VTGGTNSSKRSLGLGALLALVALAVGVMSPPGFMVAAGGSGPAIVICTGHGPAFAPGGSSSPGGADHGRGKATHDGACPFAGHGLASTRPPLGIIAKVAFAPSPATLEPRADVAPGRGLAAPPPPSQGPPVLI
jgi:hypothetical protein